MMPSDSHIAIIGAGASGLAAAYDLAKAGIKVTIIEPRPHVGGRIRTHYDHQLNFPIELGAEFLHGRSPELLELIKAANLKYEEVTGRHWYVDEGHLTKSREFWGAVEKLMERMNEETHDQTLQDYLASLPDDETSRAAKEIASLYVEGFHAAAIDRIGTNGLNAINEASDKIDGDKSFRLVDGYCSLANWLKAQSESLGASFIFNQTVDAVEWQHRKIDLHLSSGDSVNVTHAVITVPLSLLKRGDIEFSPTLPAQKLGAIQSLEMGSALRIIFQFTHRFWEQLELPGASNKDLSELGFIHHAKAPIPTWWSTLPEHEPILVGWAGGPTAERQLKLRDNDIRRLALGSLSRIFGVEESLLNRYVKQTYFHNWLLDPLSRGAYAYLPVGGIEHQLNLAKSVDDTLFFAGEATCLGHVGTVHGAIQSGQRAAREILVLFRTG